MQIILIFIQKNIDKLGQYLKYVQLLAWLLQSFWIFNTLSCNPRATISNIFNTSQTPQIAPHGLIFFLVLGYRFSIRPSQIPSGSLTIWKILARSLHVPLSFRLGMLVACCYLAWFLHVFLNSYISIISPLFFQDLSICKVDSYPIASTAMRPSRNALPVSPAMRSKPCRCG